MQLKDDELKKIIGGTAITASLLASIARVGTFVLDLGRAIGSAIRRSTSGKTCSF